MRTSRLFDGSSDEVDALVARHPLAWLVSSCDGHLDATPLPLLLRRDARGRVRLLGHFARTNPQVQALEHHPEALAVFTGPHGYVSPSWLADRTQAPTWNFAAVTMRVRVRFARSEDAARHAVEALTAHMEDGRRNGWRPAELGARYKALLTAIVAFEADVLEVRSKFKLGQNERTDVLRDILDATRGTALHAAMAHANRARLSGPDAA